MMKLHYKSDPTIPDRKLRY